MIKIMLSSGETDVWTDAVDTAVEAGAVHILANVGDDDGEELVESFTGTKIWRANPGVKVIRLSETVEDNPDRAPHTRVTPYRVLATYAPGMWMKVEY